VLKKRKTKIHLRWCCECGIFKDHRIPRKERKENVHRRRNFGKARLTYGNLLLECLCFASFSLPLSCYLAHDTPRCEKVQIQFLCQLSVLELCRWNGIDLKDALLMWFISALWRSAYVGDPWIMDLSSRFESTLKLDSTKFFFIFFLF